MCMICFFAKLHFSTPGFNPFKSPLVPLSCWVENGFRAPVTWQLRKKNCVFKFLQPTNQQFFSTQFLEHFPTTLDFSIILTPAFKKKNPFEPIIPFHIIFSWPTTPINKGFLMNQASQNEAPCRDHIGRYFGVPWQAHGFRILILPKGIMVHFGKWNFIPCTSSTLPTSWSKFKCFLYNWDFSWLFYWDAIYQPKNWACWQNP